MRESRHRPEPKCSEKNENDPRPYSPHCTNQAIYQQINASPTLRLLKESLRRGRKVDMRGSRLDSYRILSVPVYQRT